MTDLLFSLKSLPYCYSLQLITSVIFFFLKSQQRTQSHGYSMRSSTRFTSHVTTCHNIFASHLN